MRLTECQEELLGHLAAMPFLDRLEMVAVSGWSRGSIYESVEKFEVEGLAASVPHATDLIPSTRRFYLKAAGLHRLARVEGMTVDELLRLYPVSARWQRILLERLDAIAVIYRLASAIANIAHPIRFRWFRAMPMDAAIVLADGRTVAVVRQGLTSDRTSFSKRLWRLREDVSHPSAVLILAPDEVRLRHARRLSTGTPTLLALERDAALCGTGDPIWHQPSINATLDLEYVLSRLEQGGPPPTEADPSRVFLPGDIAPEEPVQDLTGHLLPAMLKPSEKRALDALSDWPWITLKYLAGLLGVSAPRVSQLLIRLEALGLATRVPASGRRLALTGQGLSLLARRDRTSVGIAKRRWSADLLNPGLPAEWRNVSGARSRQLLRNIEHTEAVHSFVTALAHQARALGWELSQIDPPRRASRYFRYGERLHSVHPDAYGTIRRSNVTWPFFLEWERRAVRPVTMAARIAPYLRYYSTHRPTDDHGAQPAVLVVFDDDLTQTHFLRVAQEEMARTRLRVPLQVSNRSLLEQVGPLGAAWRTPEGWEPVCAFQNR